VRVPPSLGRAGCGVAHLLTDTRTSLIYVKQDGQTGPDLLPPGVTAVFYFRISKRHSILFYH
jgi:hypothetical protein